MTFNPTGSALRLSANRSTGSSDRAWGSVLRVEDFVAGEDWPDLIDDGGGRVSPGSTDFDKQRVGPHGRPVLWVYQGNECKVPSSPTYLSDIQQSGESHGTNQGRDLVVGNKVTRRLNIKAAELDPAVEEEGKPHGGELLLFSRVDVVVCRTTVAAVVPLRPRVQFLGCC